MYVEERRRSCFNFEETWQTWQLWEPTEDAGGNHATGVHGL